LNGKVPADFDFSRYLSEKRAVINHALTEIIDRNFDDSRLCQAMSYSLMAPGKRLRPILCLAAADAVREPAPESPGDCPENAAEADGTRTCGDILINAACAIEMVHTYSLIHDDLPALDNDRLRRGKPTCHVQFDEATAILAGDALLTLGFEIFGSTAMLEPGSHPGVLIRVIGILGKAAGYRGMIEGQMRDMAAEIRRLDLDALSRMHTLKTGALITASVTIGALLGGGSSDQVRFLEIYAGHIGLAFQVTDDILNVEGDPDRMGKSVRTDQQRGKSTFPGILGLDQSRDFAAELVRNALQVLDGFDNRADPLRALASYVIDRNR
jgi:geranylgeranyl diphosphate synthase, type II